MPEPRLFDKRGKYFLNIVGTSGIVRQLHAVSSLAIAVARVNPVPRPSGGRFALHSSQLEQARIIG